MIIPIEFLFSSKTPIQGSFPFRITEKVPTGYNFDEISGLTPIGFNAKKLHSKLKIDAHFILEAA
jgi:hypothetical protein